MNWVISKSKKTSGQTFLNQILAPILEEVKDYNWIITDVEYNKSQSPNLPINMDDEYFILQPAEFNKLLDPHFQIWWGAVLGVPKEFKIDIDEENLPFVEGNDLLWKNGNIQHPDAEIEIDCFDSSYTIVKFKSEALSKKFYDYFTDAVELEMF